MGLRTLFWRGVGAYPVRIGGERFVCHPLHRRRWRNSANGKWEPRAFELLGDKLSQQSVLWDIGAHVGQIALYASRKCRRVVCFEPDAATLPYLHWNIARNRADNVTVVGAALAAETSFRWMGSHGDNGRAGAATNSFFPSPTAKAALTPCLGRETWGEWLRAEPPDFVKMDIEGGEFELLPVMADWLRQNRPKLMLSLHAAQLRAAGRMSVDESRRALDECASLLSFYGEFTELATGEKYPLSALPARMSGDAGNDSIWLQGVFLE